MSSSSPQSKLRLARSVLLCLVCLDAPTSLRAEDAPLSREQALALVSGLKYQEGEIPLHAGLATLRVPEGFRFLDGADSSSVLVKLWGNPPQPNPLGMLMPAGVSPSSDQSWAVIVTYEDNGYVKDADAEKINYAELLTQMQKDVVKGNEERESRLSTHSPRRLGEGPALRSRHS